LAVINAIMGRRETVKVLGETTHPAHEDSIPLLAEFVSGHAKDTGFTDQRLEEIDLSLKEALDNIIHFPCSDGDCEIHLSCVLDNAGRFVIIISDNGVPFNVLFETDTFLASDAVSASDRKPSMKLMKRYIGNIEYKRYENKNILTFIVRTPSSG
jgi:anti-sigma regulatory factor (Ser/Thr protein kinase)